MKNFKKISILSFALLTPSIVSCCTWSLQTKNDKSNKEIILYAKNNYIEVGSSLQITVSSPKSDVTEYKWSVDAPSIEIYISQTGILFASNQLKISDPVSVTVKAVNLLDETISGSIKITVIPNNLTTNFFGFEGGVIHSYDVRMKPISVNVISDPNDKKIYRLEKPLDFVQLGSREPMSWVTFAPVIRNNSTKTMKWKYVKPDSTPIKSITWVNYEDDTETDECPQFDITSSVLLKDQFEIKFLCDGEDEQKAPKLIVDFNIWMETSTAPMFAFLPSKEDHHTLEIEENEGKYSMQCFCPSVPGDLTYSNTIEGLYCFKNLHEYSNFNFVFKLNENLPFSIKNSFKYKVSAIRYQREFDNFPMYKLNFWYSFDMTYMPSAKECDYQTYEMGELQAINDEPNPWAEGWIDFYINWI